MDFHTPKSPEILREIFGHSRMEAFFVGGRRFRHMTFTSFAQFRFIPSPLVRIDCGPYSTSQG